MGAAGSRKAGQRLEWAILGPCRCQGCGLPVYWDGRHWRYSALWIHRCKTEIV